MNLKYHKIAASVLGSIILYATLMYLFPITTVAITGVCVIYSLAYSAAKEIFE